MIYIPKGFAHWYESVTKNRFRFASSVWAGLVRVGRHKLLLKVVGVAEPEPDLLPHVTLQPDIRRSHIN